MTGIEVDGNQTEAYIRVKGTKSLNDNQPVDSTTGTAKLLTEDPTFEVQTKSKEVCKQLRSGNETLSNTKETNKPRSPEDVNLYLASMNSENMHLSCPLLGNFTDIRFCYELLRNLSIDRSIPAAQLDDAVRSLISLLERINPVQHLDSAIGLVANHELTLTLSEQDLSKKRNRISVVLGVLQTVLAKAWNVEQIETTASHDPSTHALKTAKDCELSTSVNTISANRHKHSLASEASSIRTRSKTRSAGTNKNRTGKNKRSEMHKVQKNQAVRQQIVYPQVTNSPDLVSSLESMFGSAARYTMPTEGLCSDRDTSLYQQTLRNNANFIFDEVAASCPQQYAAPYFRDQQAALNTVIKAPLPAPDLNHALNRIVDLSLCHNLGQLPHEASVVQSLPQLSLDRLTLSGSDYQTDSLSIPEVPDEVSSRLSPPRIPQPQSRLKQKSGKNAKQSMNIFEDTERIASYLVDLKECRRRCSSAPPEVENSSFDKEKSIIESKTPAKTSSLVVLTSAVLLTSGERQCLVVPTESQKAETIVNLTEEDMEVLIGKGAAIPLTSKQPDGLPSVRNIPKAGKRELRRSKSVDRCTSETGRTSVKESRQAYVEPMSRLSTLLGKDVIELERPPDHFVPTVDLTRPSFPQYTSNKRTISSSFNQATHHHQQSKTISTRKDKRRFVKCLLRSIGTFEQSSCDLFYISGFVSGELWNRLPAVIEIASFEEKSNLLEFISQDDLVDLTLDKDSIESSGEHQVFRLFHMHLSVICQLPNLLLAIVPIQLPSNNYGINVYAKFC